MKIIKRNKQAEVFTLDKIKSAVKRAFEAQKEAILEDELISLCEKILEEIRFKIKDGQEIEVEQVQDVVEEVLMKSGYLKVAKAYILYRSERMKARDVLNKFRELIDDEGIISLLKEIQIYYAEAIYSLEILYGKFSSFYKKNSDNLALLVRSAAELVTDKAPNWEFVASRFYVLSLQRSLEKEEERLNLLSFYDKIKYLTQEGLYGAYILDNYSHEEVDALEKIIDDERNHLFNYSGLDLLAKRYLIKDRMGKLLENPQEMFMGIAMHLALPEGDKKVQWAKNIYDILSSLKVTMATPTMSNSRKPLSQLSSCFIDVMPDNLLGIYRSIDNFAQVSKYGGGMGMYIGKIRAMGSDIRGFRNVAGGVLKWVKLLNDTAVAVDQLGVRQGAVAVYLDIWHRDMPEFLQVRTNNGDDRMKAHDIFPGVCIPDYFWDQVKNNIEGKWYMLCPHEVSSIKGYMLEDYFGEEWQKRYLDCLNDNRLKKREIAIKELLRMIIKSAFETGTPFIFNRDIVNRMNPNGHKGIIYCSNLCTEIAQNQREIELKQQVVELEDGQEVVVEKTIAGDFVTCNLASLVLGNIDVDNPEELEYITSTVVRALDNVIDLNFYATPYAKITNKKMRPIGLGTSGYHHLLAKKRIKWDSQEHLQFMDKLYEDINYYSIKASMQLAQEKGRYCYFEGSDWHTGEYFSKREYTSDRWNDLAQEVALRGMRNSYLIAIAPTSSTSVIVGTTAGTDPIMHRFYWEEKKGSMMPRVAPDLRDENYWYYRTAYEFDQNWLIDAAAIRQRHIDQAQSVNLFVYNEKITFSGLKDLYLRAWEKGVKTLYYVRSKSLEVEDCENCSA